MSYEKRNRDVYKYHELQKWLRLFEQLSPIFKWIPGGLVTVQCCPRRWSFDANLRIREIVLHQP